MTNLLGTRQWHRPDYCCYGTRLGASVEYPYIFPSSCPHPASGPWDWINAGHSLSTAHRNKQTGIRFLVSTLVPNSLEPGMILFPNPACSHPDPRHPKHWQSATKYPLPCRCPSLIRQVIDCRWQMPIYIKSTAAVCPMLRINDNPSNSSSTSQNSYDKSNESNRFINFSHSDDKSNKTI